MNNFSFHHFHRKSFSYYVFITEKGFCMRGDLCPYDHGLDPVIVEDVSIPPPPYVPGNRSIFCQASKKSQNSSTVSTA